MSVTIDEENKWPIVKALTDTTLNDPKIKRIVGEHSYNASGKVVHFSSSGARILIMLDSLSSYEKENKEVFYDHQETVFKSMVNYCLTQTDQSLKSVLIMPFKPCRFPDDAAFSVAFTTLLGRMFSLADKHAANLIAINGHGLFGRVAGYFKLFPKSKKAIDWRKYLNRIFEIEWKGVTYKIMGTLEVQKLSTQNKDEMGTLPNLIGYWCKGFTQAIEGRNWYTLNLDLEAVRCLNVNTVKKFDQFYERLIEAKRVYIDTETSGLGRVKNRVLSIQFAFNSKVAFFIPIHHSETPFSAKELDYIIGKLRHYFEFNTNAEYHCYHNASFDLTVMKIQDGGFGVRYFQAPVLDTTATTFSCDENLKFIATYFKDKKFGAYKLDGVCQSYGCNIYNELDFSKDDRANMEQSKLSDALITYASVDVLVLPELVKFQTHECTVRQGQTNFLKFQLVQFNAMIKSFVTAESTGALADKKYLAGQMAKGSEINNEIQKLEGELKKFPSIQKANTHLLKKAGLPSGGGLFGQTNWIFSSSKPAHKAHLFFDVLGLEPLTLGKDGKTGKIDKGFQEHYSKVPEIRGFTAISKAKSIKNSFISGLYKIVCESDASDSRIRCRYSYLTVVTGRTSGQKPNLQNIPSRGPLAKIVKRLFIAGPGNALVKIDFSSHEIGMWANCSGDSDLANLAKTGYKLRLKYRLEPTSKCLSDVSDLGDLHKLNYKHFYGRLPNTTEERDSIKSTIFGCIYGKQADGLSKSLKITKEEAQKLIDLLFEKFKKGGTFLKQVQAKSKRTLLAVSPIFRTRHLPAYLHNKPGVRNAMDRRGPNAIIQGIASDCLLLGSSILESLVWNYFVKHDIDVYIKQSNFVHDAIEGCIRVELIPVYCYLLEHSCTTLVHKTYRETFGFRMLKPLEIDFSIGYALSSMYKWDYNTFGVGVETLDKEGNKKKVPNLIEISKMVVTDCAKLHPDYWTKDCQEKVLKSFEHNAKIINKFRTEEIKLQLKSNLPNETMLITEENAREIGLIFDAMKHKF